MAIKKSVALFDDQYKFYKELKSEKLMITFVEFMFEWIEPKWLNSLEETIFNSLRVRMENQIKKSEAGSRWWAKSHWWGRPKKITNEQQNNNQKTSKKQTENNQVEVKVEVKDKVEVKVKDKKENKNKFLEFVFLTETEYQNLVDRFWKRFTDESIEKLNNYIWSTGKKYKSHYYTILNWSKKEWPSKSNIELLQERDRQRRLEEAQEVLNRSKNWNEANDKNGTFNRRENFIG